MQASLGWWSLNITFVWTVFLSLLLSSDPQLNPVLDPFLLAPISNTNCDFCDREPKHAWVPAHHLDQKFVGSVPWGYCLRAMLKTFANIKSSDCWLMIEVQKIAANCQSWIFANCVSFVRVSLNMSPTSATICLKLSFKLVFLEVIVVKNEK